MQSKSNKGTTRFLTRKKPPYFFKDLYQAENLADKVKGVTLMQTKNEALVQNRFLQNRLMMEEKITCSHPNLPVERAQGKTLHWMYGVSYAVFGFSTYKIPNSTFGKILESHCPPEQTKMELARSLIWCSGQLSISRLEYDLYRLSF